MTKGERRLPLTSLLPLAEAFLNLDDAEQAFGDGNAHASSALALVAAMNGDRQLFLQLDERLRERAFAARLLDLPMQLSEAGQSEQALRVADAIAFLDREMNRCDRAIILAHAGQREAALAQLEANLEQAIDRALVEAKTGDAYRALGDLPAAEAYYRRSLVEATQDIPRKYALLRLLNCLIESDRPDEASALMREEKARAAAETADRPVPDTNDNASLRVGRNQLCPCGSGKKYKKCHG